MVIQGLLGFLSFGDVLSKFMGVVAALTSGLGWYLTRPRLRIRIVDDDGDDGLTFEVENTGRRSTSLDPVVLSSYWFFVQLRPRRGRAIYDVREQNRGLPPFEAKRFRAIPRETLPDGYVFSWFRSYQFKPTTGLRRPSRARVESALLEPLRPIAFWSGILRLRLFGYVRPLPPMSISEYEGLKRSRGSF